MLPVSHNTLLRVDELHASAAHRCVQLVFDAIFRPRFIPGLRPQITHVVRTAVISGEIIPIFSGENFPSSSHEEASIMPVSSMEA